MQIVVEEEANRIDLVLKKKWPEHSRAFFQRLIREGCVSVNGVVAKNTHLSVRRSDRVECRFPEKQDFSVQGRTPTGEAKRVGAPSLKIIFEDPDFVVIDKPAGISVHSSPTDSRESLVTYLLASMKPLSGVGGAMRPGIVHRLDRDTSGVILIAKNDIAHARLAAQWKSRKVAKEYTALVSGVMESSRGVIEAPIGRSSRDRKKMAVSDKRGSREATTEYRVIETFSGRVSLLLVKPKTGRTHQIRVHLASIGHPVLGDLLYGEKKENDEFESEFGLARQFLHASKLTVTHPTTKKRISFSAKLPADLQGVIDGLRSSML